MGEQLMRLGMRAVELMPKSCRADALKVLEHRRKIFDEEGLPNEVQGYGMPPCFEGESTKYAYDQLKLNKGDILIATYPKTGTTWTLGVVQQILHGKNQEELDRLSALRLFISYLEFGPASKYQIYDRLNFPQQVFGTHLPAPLVNLKKYRERGVKVIHMIRNPKDQMVSWRNFITSFPHSKMDHWKELMPENEKDFYDMFLAGKQHAFAKDGEGYLEYIKEWYEHKDDDNILFLVFEEMKKDPEKEIRKIAKFIGHPLTDEELKEVVEKTSFRTMKEKHGKQGFDSKDGFTMFRKGQIGEWRNHLTVAQSELVDRKVEEILGNTGVKFIYE